jgi:ribosome-interacting GTPase 1
MSQATLTPVSGQPAGSASGSHAPPAASGSGSGSHAPPAASGSGSSCHASPAASGSGAAFRVALIGAPNVGKSALFNRLTHSYVTVSNFPGTSVEVSRGRARLGGVSAEVLDTPGLYSLLSTTDEGGDPAIVLGGEADAVHAVDAKNLAACSRSRCS